MWSKMIFSMRNVCIKRATTIKKTPIKDNIIKKNQRMAYEDTNYQKDMRSVNFEIEIFVMTKLFKKRIFALI